MKDDFFSAIRTRFWVAAIVSVIIAAAGFWVGPGRWLAFDRGNDVPNAETLRYCTYFALAWVAWFLITAFRYRWKDSLVASVCAVRNAVANNVLA